MKTITIKIELPREAEIFTKTVTDVGNKKYKQCPYCGQAKLPFKMGVCVECGHQIGNITYVNNAEGYAKKWYEYIGSQKVEKLGIIELVDN